MPLRSLRAATLGLVLGAAPGLAADVAVPVLDWRPCPQAVSATMLCAVATVPLDHADPSGPTVDLALIKAPARDPAARIGTLFWNPGGPGDSGTAYLPAAIGGFPDRVRDRFDVVSWDPRGMGGRSTPVVRCFEDAGAEAEFLGAKLPDGLPTTPADLAAFAAGHAAFSQACAARSGALLAHVSTADNARDLDLLRQAVGEATLSYYGTSYGTFLGATYVNMFPDRVRAAVLDGAIAPSAWAGGPGEDLALGTFVRVGSDFAAADTIRAFLDQCGAVDAAACAFSAGSPAATRAKWDALLARAQAGLTADGETYDAGDLRAYVASSLYTIAPLDGFGRIPGWVAVAQFLQTVWRAGEGGEAAAPSTEPAQAQSATPAREPAQAPAAAPAPEQAQAPSAEPYVTSAGRQLAVICGESPNPPTAAAFAAQAEASFARAGLSPWPFVAACTGWTARAANPYLGPWDRPTPVPILVIGNAHDPATPLSGSIRLAQELADARVLVVNGFGHTMLINPSACAQDYVAAYLIDGRTPPLGASCPQDGAPFPGD